MLEGYSLLEVGGFFVLVIVALVVDLYAHKKDEAISIKSSVLWTIFWIFLAFVFAGYIWKAHSADDASLFIAGYLLEKSLSVDNLFVIMAIFANFAVKDEYQHRVLYFGILGAIIFRLIFVAGGTTLIALFGKWALLAFGIFILWSAWKMWQASKEDTHEIEDYNDHWSVRFTKKIFPVYDKLVGHNFFVREGGKLYVTPLFLCLVAVEVADVMFAFDSVPAIIAITQKTFLVYTSNIFAILGLRSMYFMLAAAKRYLCHLEKAVIVILVFIGIKMLIAVAGISHINPMVSLAIVVGLLILGVLASFIWPDKGQKCSE